MEADQVAGSLGDPGRVRAWREVVPAPKSRPPLSNVDPSHDATVAEPPTGGDPVIGSQGGAGKTGAMNDHSPLRPRDRDVAVRRLRSIRTGATVAGLASFAGLAALAAVSAPGTVDATVATIGTTTSTVTTTATGSGSTTTSGSGTTSGATTTTTAMATPTTVAIPTQTPSATAAPAQVTSGGSG